MITHEWLAKESVRKTGIGFTMVFEDGERLDGCLHREPFDTDEKIIAECNETNPKRWGKVVAIEDKKSTIYYSGQEPEPDIDEREIQLKNGRRAKLLSPELADDYKILKVFLNTPDSRWLDFETWLHRENDYHCVQMPITKAVVRNGAREFEVFAKHWSTWDELSKNWYVVRIGLGAYGGTIVWRRRLVRQGGN